MSSFQIGIHLFLQLTVIILSCRVLGWIGRRFLRQTQVLMEMVTGMLLGPSVLGALSPATQAWLFPKVLLVQTASGAVAVPHPSMSILYALAQVGLVLYMFVIGLEFDLSLLRGRFKHAGIVSGMGIAGPFIAGGAILPYLLSRHDLFSEKITLGVAFLFVGASVSITAFPMLARILYERGVAGTQLGTLTLAAGSIDDAVAWCLLALVLAVFNDRPQTAAMTLGGGLLYGALMMTIGRRLLARFERAFVRSGRLTEDSFSLLVVVLVSCAFVTDYLGIYAVFGAFLCGAAMPKGKFAAAVVVRIEGVTTSLLLPMFFVYSGLNTKLSLVNTTALWGVAAVVITISILGKGVACMLAARSSGQTWTASAMVGTLMNARGLMELILLNIGLEHGVITPTFFTIMVLMAVVTTAMASPLYDLLSRDHDFLARRVTQSESMPCTSEAVRP